MSRKYQIIALIPSIAPIDDPGDEDDVDGIPQGGVAPTQTDDDDDSTPFDAW